LVPQDDLRCGRKLLNAWGLVLSFDVPLISSALAKAQIEF